MGRRVEPAREDRIAYDEHGRPVVIRDEAAYRELRARGRAIIEGDPLAVRLARGEITPASGAASERPARGPAGGDTTARS